jgi:hypothetical protein
MDARAVAPQEAPDTDRSVAGGGITVSGWTGKVDAAAEQKGQSIKDAKLAQQGKDLHVVTGPAVTYWNPANKASGNYTVKATFTEGKYMNLNDHPHPYGIMIAGNDLGTDQQSLLYCAAYGNGNFIVRGFGPEPFQMGGRRPQANPAVKQAAGKDQAVTPEIASYDKTELVGPGKLKSTDGLYGIRFAHNTEGTVTGLTMTKN